MYITCVVGALVSNVKSQRVSGCIVRRKHLRKPEQTRRVSCLWLIRVRFLSVNNSAPSCTCIHPVAYIALVKTKADLKGACHQNSLATFTLPTGIWRFVIIQGSHTTCPVQSIQSILQLFFTFGQTLNNFLIGT